MTKTIVHLIAVLMFSMGAALASIDSATASDEKYQRVADRNLTTNADEECADSYPFA